MDGRTRANWRELNEKRPLFLADAPDYKSIIQCRVRKRLIRPFRPLVAHGTELLRRFYIFSSPTSFRLCYCERLSMLSQASLNPLAEVRVLPRESRFLDVSSLIYDTVYKELKQPNRNFFFIDEYKDTWYCFKRIFGSWVFNSFSRGNLFKEYWLIWYNSLFFK